jgi:2-haloacid dehalogenase
MHATRLPKAILFDTFGTVVDWRTSIIAELTSFGSERGIEADWEDFADRWRGQYAPSMDRVRTGEIGWTSLDDLHRLSLVRLLEELGVVGVADSDLDQLSLAWHRLQPWPDSVPGLSRLKQGFVIGPLSNGTVALLVDLAKFGGLPWDVVFGSDLFEHYKPDPETYLGACSLLQLDPSQVMMAAAHPTDLRVARGLGLQTAFFPRPTEHGPARAAADSGAAAKETWDVVAGDIVDLAIQLGA